ncbi:MAG TPA: glycosyltransferase family A protein [Candidatus Limnocylindria bacterium]|nr:glycosyltransferase family A protein [Candidatus Limnocylindria bacterium]
MTPLPTFSVVIPTYNRADVVERTLRQLDAQDYPPDRFEVIVVDNSTDDTPAMVGRLAASSRAPIRLLHRSERLPAVKRNIGLHAATGDLVLFLNDDVWARPDFLAEHARSHGERPGRLVAVVGHVEQSPEMPRTPFLEFYRPFAFHEIAAAADREVSSRHFWSMNLSLPRDEMLARNLVFHEDWAEIGHEDVELGHRWAKAGGVIVYNPRAYVEHYHPHTLDSACRLQESIGRGLRDLEKLVPEPDLLERYGVFSWRNSPRSIVRGLVRKALFNAFTVPYAKAWLERQTRNSRLTRWMYWKVMLHFTERGYRAAPARSPRPLPIRSAEPT